MFQRIVGGSRTINIKKNANENDIKDIVFPWFFPGGKSHISQKHHFTHRIGNFIGEPLLDNFSLADYIGEHKLTHCIFYQKKNTNNRIQDILDLDEEFSNSDDFEPEKFLNPFSANPGHGESVNGKASDEQTKSTLCMKCFSTKGDKVSLKVNRSYEVNQSFIREQRKAKLPAELCLSDQSTVARVQHIKGRLTKFCHPDSKYEDVYNWIGAFYESPLYFYLKTDPINIVDPNEVV